MRFSKWNAYKLLFKNFPGMKLVPFVISMSQYQKTMISPNLTWLFVFKTTQRMCGYMLHKENIVFADEHYRVTILSSGRTANFTLRIK